MKVICNENCNTVLKCYEIEYKELDEIILALMASRILNNLKITRSYNSYKRELKAHIRLYKLGLFKEHTKDADLEENIKLWKEIFYLLIGW